MYNPETKKRSLVITALMLLTFPVALPSEDARADHENEWPDFYDRDLRDDGSYIIKSKTLNAAGEPITIRTKVENDHDAHKSRTIITGPEGRIGSEDIEVEYDDDEITRRTRTVHPDGTVNIDKQTYEIGD